ncbi:hypothetical protein Rhe02_57880 [Rhizocola hellebori]|uniref:Uncharacterized protein n=1 Tax=Rhizocola hellebori TaxID=1392758 RepID=A0A8J3VJ47_9ACTN|nr:hypothetical protein Rhe02_57880 [Rhizocola hellebori]
MNVTVAAEAFGAWVRTATVIATAVRVTAAPDANTALVVRVDMLTEPFVGVFKGQACDVTQVVGTAHVENREGVVDAG